MNDSFIEEVDNEFPGLRRMIHGTFLELYQFLHDLKELGDEEDFESFFDDYPHIYEYLMYNDPNPNLIPGPPSRLIKAMLDLLNVIFEIQWEVEEAEIDENNNHLGM